MLFELCFPLMHLLHIKVCRDFIYSILWENCFWSATLSSRNDVYIQLHCNSKYDLVEIYTECVYRCISILFLIILYSYVYVIITVSRFLVVCLRHHEMVQKPGSAVYTPPYPGFYRSNPGNISSVSETTIRCLQVQNMTRILVCM